MGWLLEKVVLELSGVEEVFNVGAEVEVGLELRVVEDWTTEGDELVDWTEEGVSLDVGEEETVETGVEETDASNANMNNKTNNQESNAYLWSSDSKL